MVGFRDIPIKQKLVIIIMVTTGAMNAGSFEKVMRTHSSAISREDNMGSHASRPNAYQLA